MISKDDFAAGQKTCEFKLYGNNNELRDELIKYLVQGSEGIGATRDKLSCRYAFYASAHEEPFGDNNYDYGRPEALSRQIIAELEINYTEQRLAEESLIGLSTFAGLATLAGLTGVHKSHRSSIGKRGFAALSAMGLMFVTAAVLNQEKAPIATDFVYSLLIVGGATALAAGFFILKSTKSLF